jgi:RND family efflux transporter MFP subunit
MRFQISDFRFPISDWGRPIRVTTLRPGSPFLRIRQSAIGNRQFLPLLLLLSACGGPKVQPGKVDAVAGVPLPAGAAVVTVAARPLAPRIDVIGTVASEKTITLSSRLSAYVQEVQVAAGDRVKAGQVLMTLDDREIREQRSAAEAQFKQADREYERVWGLKEKGAATEQSLTAAEAAHTSAKAQLERVNVMMSYAQVTAPIDGVVTERRVEAGDLAGPGQPLLVVYDPARMRLEVPVPVRLIQRVALGGQVEVTLDQGANPVPGVITEIVSEIDPLSRTRKVKVRLVGADGVLPGTFGRLWLEDEPRATLLIPPAAITRVGQLETVQVVQGDRLLQRLVRSGPARGDQVEILSGLNAGEQVLAGAPARE